MTMNPGVFNRALLISFLTLSVNILLFTGLPNMLPGESLQSNIESIQTVDFLRTWPESRQAPKAQTPEETPPPEPARTISRKTMKTRTSPPQSVKMDMPTFDLDVAPDIHPGIALTAPMQTAARPSTFAPKEFYGLREVDQTPVAVVKNRPDYPYRARRLNIDGKVDVKFLVDKDGRVSRISILHSIPPNIFDQSVTRALALWRFAPGKVKGRAVNTWVTTTIVFKLDDL